MEKARTSNNEEHGEMPIRMRQGILPGTVLVADDDPDHCRLTEEAWKETHVGLNLRFVHDGDDLLDYLYRRGRYSDSLHSPRPGAILLDLNMPKKSGREALLEIKSDPTFSRIPIVILTTSKNATDMYQTSMLGVNGFITKPKSFTGYMELMKNLVTHWTEVVDGPFPTINPGPSDWLGKVAWS